MAVAATPPRAGTLLREWRLRRNLSQFELATGSACSTRHLSFIETGRSRPSREMILHLAGRLDVPLREQNRLLLAAGYAPVFGERRLDDEEMTPVRAALERLVAAQEPYPAVVVDRHWNLVLANGGLPLLVEGVWPRLLEPPANALRVTLHPQGMAPRIVNFAQWSGHLLHRLARQAAVSGDEGLAALHAELAGYPGVSLEPHPADVSAATDIALPLRLRRGNDELSLLSTVTTFGTALDVGLAELSVESFFPADDATAALLRGR